MKERALYINTLYKILNNNWGQLVWKTSKSDLYRLFQNIRK